MLALWPHQLARELGLLMLPPQSCWLQAGKCGACHMWGPPAATGANNRPDATAGQNSGAVLCSSTCAASAGACAVVASHHPVCSKTGKISCLL